MDIHRCRFVPYPPSAINALAFSHPSSLATKGRGPATLRLAIGRANGDIEIWNPMKGAWFQESILRGGRDRSIEGLVWTQDPDEEDKTGWKTPGKLRLFSIGYSTAVTEWDLAQGGPVRHSSGNYGDVWCIAAQPRWQDSKNLTGRAVNSTSQQHSEYRSQHIAVGCADGAVVLLSTEDDDLRFLRTFARPSKKKARVLSIAFQSRDVVVAGHADSTIRVYDIRNGQQLRSMSLGAGPAGGPKETLVWTIKCLVDGTIISGDSTGSIRFWDGKNYSMLQRINSHMADVLDVAASVDGETVFSGGMDRRTTVYRKMGSGKRGDRYRWVETTHRRIHKHDIKTMATFETKVFSVLASGGLDTTPVIIPLREFGKENSRSLSSLPNLPPLRSAPGQNLMMSWWNREVNVWQMSGFQKSQFGSEEGDDSGEARSKHLVARIALQGEENVTCADLSSNGSLLSVSTICEVKVFRLRRRRHDARERLRVHKFELPKSMHDFGARIVQFSPDNKWFVVIKPDNSILVFRVRLYTTLTEHEFMPRPVELKRLSRDSANPTLQHGSLGNYDRSISRVAFSADSRVLVVGDISGYLDSWVLEGHEDLTQESDDDEVGSGSSESSDDEGESKAEHHIIVLGQHWIRNPSASLLPKLPAAPLILSFRPRKVSSSLALTNGNTAVHPTRHNAHPHSHDLPDGEDRLLALTCEHQIYEFQLLSGRLSDWSRRNPTSSLPRGFRDIRERAMGSIWDVQSGRQRVWFYGNSWLFMFDLSKDMPPSVKQDGQSSEGEAGNYVPNNGKSRNKRKRKRVNADGNKTLEQDSGAGNKICDAELHSGISRKIRKSEGPECNEFGWISLDREPTPPTEDDEDKREGGSALNILRRGIISEDRVRSNGHIDADADADADVDIDGESRVNVYMDSSSKDARLSPPYWSTFKYRPILGIVLIGGGDKLGRTNGTGKQFDDDDECRRGVEVALVERPMWEVDLPPRYHGDQEWDK